MKAILLTPTYFLLSSQWFIQCAWHTVAKLAIQTHVSISVLTAVLVLKPPIRVSNNSLPFPHGLCTSISQADCNVSLTAEIFQDCQTKNLFTVPPALCLLKNTHLFPIVVITTWQWPP